MKKIVIGQSYLEEHGEFTRLCVDILRDDKSFKLYYEFDKEYQSYICTEVVDPFLVAIIPYAMELNYDLYCDAPVSNDIFESFVVDFIPVLAKYQDYFSHIKLECKQRVNYIHQKGQAVGTGVSCGVDSLYTIKTHTNMNEDISEGHAITHLCIMNAGSCGYSGGEKSYQWFCKEIGAAQKVCDELGLTLIKINTNLMEFYERDHSHSGTLRMAGCVLALDKLFGRYYLASGYEMNHFQFANDDASYAFYTLNCVETQNTDFILTGNSCDRDDRIKVIADWSIAQKYLNVCWSGARNCGCCEKCLRTMGALYSINKLNCFKQCFDVTKFENHIRKNVSRMFFYSKKHPEQYRFLRTLRREKKRIYYHAKLRSIFMVFPYEMLKSTIRGIINPKGKMYSGLKKMLKK